MLRKTETRAIHLIRGLYDAAEGRPNQWHFLDKLNVPQGAEPYSTPQAADGYLSRAETMSALPMPAGV